MELLIGVAGVAEVDEVEVDVFDLCPAQFGFVIAVLDGLGGPSYFRQRKCYPFRVRSEFFGTGTEFRDRVAEGFA